jgi:hypothetical protein
MRSEDFKIELENMLPSFCPIYLEETEKISLMNRVDTKYVFSLKILPDLLSLCKKNYRALEISGLKNHPYDSLYFDTKDYVLYHEHHRAKLNRYKIRLRTYISGEKKSFLEVKFKDNKEKTFKKRISSTPLEETNYFFTEAQSSFIAHQTPLKANEIKPSLKVKYNRITLVHLKMNERVTIDTDLAFSIGNKFIRLDNLVITEVKRNSLAEKTEIMERLKSLRVKEGGLSKYCTGMALIYDDLKKNNFKEKLRAILKINQQ